MNEDILFDPRYFGQDEFDHWYKSQEDAIIFYGQPFELKKVRSRISHYAGSRKVQSKKISDKILSVKKV